MGETRANRLRLWTSILITGAGVSSIGDFIYLVAINVFVLDQTHSAAAVAGMWVASRVASLSVGPWAGSVTDRFSRRKQLILIEITRALLIGVLPFCREIAGIYADLFMLGVCSTFFSNVFLPYQTLLIPQEQRKRVNAVISTLRYSASLTGPAIAGVLLLHGDVTLPLWLDAGSFLVSGVSFILLPPLDPESTGSLSSNMWRMLRLDWWDAVAFLRQNRLFTGVLILYIAIGVLGLTADSQEVVFANQALHLGQLGYGLMVTAAGVGFVSGSLLLSVFAKRLPTHGLLGIGTLGSAAGYLLYSFAHNFWWAVAGLIVLGLFGSAAGVGFTTYRQHTVPVSHMGRLNNVIGPPQQLLSIILLLLGGFVATRYGVRSLMIGMTVPMCIAGMIMAVLVLLPQNRMKVSTVDV